VRVRWRGYPVVGVHWMWFPGGNPNLCCLGSDSESHGGGCYWGGGHVSPGRSSGAGPTEGLGRGSLGWGLWWGSPGGGAIEVVL
jgi:hypothetical protein